MGGDGGRRWRKVGGEGWWYVGVEGRRVVRTWQDSKERAERRRRAVVWGDIMGRGVGWVRGRLKSGWRREKGAADLEI